MLYVQIRNVGFANATFKIEILHYFTHNEEPSLLNVTGAWGRDTPHPHNIHPSKFPGYFFIMYFLNYMLMYGIH